MYRLKISTEQKNHDVNAPKTRGRKEVAEMLRIELTSACVRRSSFSVLTFDLSEPEIWSSIEIKIH
jgi:hypothetical protein